jgi:hypothetical protein
MSVPLHRDWRIVDQVDGREAEGRPPGTKRRDWNDPLSTERRIRNFLHSLSLQPW